MPSIKYGPDGSYSFIELNFHRPISAIVLDAIHQESAVNSTKVLKDGRSCHVYFKPDATKRQMAEAELRLTEQLDAEVPDWDTCFEIELVGVFWMAQRVGWVRTLKNMQLPSILCGRLLLCNQGLNVKGLILFGFILFALQMLMVASIHATSMFLLTESTILKLLGFVLTAPMWFMWGLSLFGGLASSVPAWSNDDPVRDPLGIKKDTPAYVTATVGLLFAVCMPVLLFVKFGIQPFYLLTCIAGGIYLLRAFTLKQIKTFEYL